MTTLAHLYAARECLRVVAQNCDDRDRQRARMRLSRQQKQMAPVLPTPEPLELTG
jgi:hypothetical protein